MQKREFILEKNTERQIYGDLRVPPSSGEKPLVVFCHGFKGFKNWGGWQYAMDKICESGFAVIAFNFSHNGIGADLENFTELEKFAENTIGKELEDLTLLFREIKSGREFPELEWNGKVGLIGHSRGGGVVILFASQNPVINCLVTLASIGSFDHYLKRADECRVKGYTEFENARTNQIMRINAGFFEDLENNREKRDVMEAESKLNVPHLIIHGEKDEAVPVDHARKLFEQAQNRESKLEIIPGGMHTFGQTHPFRRNSSRLDSVIQKTIDWFQQYMR